MGLREGLLARGSKYVCFIEGGDSSFPGSPLFCRTHHGIDLIDMPRWLLRQRGDNQGRETEMENQHLEYGKTHRLQNFEDAGLFVSKWLDSKTGRPNTRAPGLVLGCLDAHFSLLCITVTKRPGRRNSREESWFGLPVSVQCMVGQLHILGYRWHKTLQQKGTEEERSSGSAD